MEQHELLAIVTAIVFSGNVNEASKTAREIIERSKSKHEEVNDEPPEDFSKRNAGGMF